MEEQLKMKLQAYGLLEETEYVNQDAKPTLDKEKRDLYIKLLQLDELKSVNAKLTFFVVLAILSLIGSLIILLSVH